MALRKIGNEATNSYSMNIQQYKIHVHWVSCSVFAMEFNQFKVSGVSTRRVLGPKHEHEQRTVESHEQINKRYIPAQQN